MKAVNIKLSLAENVKTFVNIANRYPTISTFALGGTWWTASPFWVSSVWISPSRYTLEVYADNCDDLMEEIKPFIIG